MNTTLTLKAATTSAAAAGTAAPARVLTDTVQIAVQRACSRIAPLWPLDRFVAVNPFLGLADQTFEQAAATLARVAGARLTMDRRFFREQQASGRLGEEDLRAALAEAGQPMPLAALQAELDTDVPAPVAQVQTVADRSPWRSTMVEHISRWCAAAFDSGQAAWPSPWQGLPLYATWRAAAAINRMPEVLGISGFRARVAGLPPDPLQTIAAVLSQTHPAAAGLEDYLHRALLDVGGWAAWARWQQWQAELAGGQDDTLVQLLAIRLAWEWALLDHARPACAAPCSTPAPQRVEMILQRAFELGYQRRLLGQLQPAQPGGATQRPAAQAVFCIDVRSEVYRRALEAAMPGVQTLGFAGFFGMALSVQGTDGRSRTQCPVLLQPRLSVMESAPQPEAWLERVRAGWRQLRQSAVGAFPAVEALGLAAAPRLLERSLPHTDEFAASGAGRYRRYAAPGPVADRVALAHTVLGAMGLIGQSAPPPARLVLLAGHGSRSANNPHASGLDCGACGGHSGEANARTAAALLNDPEVRAGLTSRGVAWPEDSWFVAGLHNTTTDALELFDTDILPATHRADLAMLQAALAAASQACRLERAPRLPGPAPQRRSRDWSQVRPEWGLAGNAAFIAAPRARTRGAVLAGRCFLHDYRWQDDEGFKVLELILTAPMIVASWINLQYYGSTVDNTAFGSGNKVLHNVVGGTVGVLEGSGGDLRTGLPWQSLHDGQHLVHEPLRLTVLADAPLQAISGVIQQQAGVRRLLDHGWLHLVCIHGMAKRYAGHGRWVDMPSPSR